MIFSRSLPAFVTLLLFLTTSLAPNLHAQNSSESPLHFALGAHAKVIVDLNRKLGDTFDKEIELTRHKQGLSPQKLQLTIEGLQKEKRLFLNGGTLPFSATMRPATQIYLRDFRLSADKLAKAYDAEISTAMRGHDDATATKLAKEKKFACRKKVNSWACQGVSSGDKWNWVLFTDETAGTPSVRWSLTASGVVLINKNATAPPSGWIDKWIVAEDGMSFKAKNQDGAGHIGQRTD